MHIFAIGEACGAQHGTSIYANEYQVRIHVANNKTNRLRHVLLCGECEQISREKKQQLEGKRKTYQIGGVSCKWIFGYNVT